MTYVAISSSEKHIEIGLSVLGNPKKYHWVMSPVAVVKTSSERDTQRDRVSRSVTVGRTDGRRESRSLYSNVQPSVAIKLSKLTTVRTFVVFL